MKARRNGNCAKFFERFCASLQFWALALVLLATQTGCATSELWSKNKFYPATPAQLNLFESKQPADILIQYQEQHAGKDDSRSRAYFLFANATNLAAGRRPNFVGVSLGNELKPIPILNLAFASTNQLPTTGYFAMTTTNQEAFELYRDGASGGIFSRHEFSPRELTQRFWEFQATTLSPLPHFETDPLLFGLSIILKCGRSFLVAFGLG